MTSSSSMENTLAMAATSSRIACQILPLSAGLATPGQHLPACCAAPARGLEHGEGRTEPVPEVQVFTS